MKPVIRCLLLCLCVASSAFARAAEPPSTLDRIRERGELRVGLETGYIPFEMRDKRGGIIGFDVDLAKLMARKLGVRLRLVNTQWDGIIPALLTDKFDVLMSGMTITEGRAKQVDFAQPYIVAGQTILIQPALAARIKTYADLDAPGFTIAVKLGTTGETAAREYMPRSKIESFESESEGLLQVRSGRAQAFVYDLPFNLVYMARNPGALVHLSQPFTSEPLGWALRKNDLQWRDWLNAYLAGIRADGAYQALYGKWFQRKAWLGLIS